MIDTFQEVLNTYANRQQEGQQLAAFSKNRVYGFAPNEIQSEVEHFRQLNGETVKAGLKSFQKSL